MCCMRKYLLIAPNLPHSSGMPQVGHTKARSTYSSLQWRPDIDGLRAIAVISVLGFHAFPSIFKGGFVGVDIFFVFFRWNISLTLILWVLTIVSFGINILYMNTSLAGNFYSPVSRMFELLSGSLLAVHTLRTKQAVGPDRSIHMWFPLLGIVLIFAAVFSNLDQARFPGYSVLVPVIGTALVIYSGTTHRFGKYLLTNRFIVFIGLISYPLYLWHWPLLSFASIIYGRTPPGIIRLALVGLAFVLAILLYKFLEKPIKANKSKWCSFILCLAMIVVGLFGYKTYLHKGELLLPVPHLYTKIFDGKFGDGNFFQELALRFYPCESASYLKSAPEYKATPRCYQSKIGEPVTTILVGDSHAEALYPGVANKLADENVSYVVAGYALTLENPGFATFFEEIQSNRDINIVIIAAYWITAGTYAIPEGSSFEIELRKAIELITGSGKSVYLIIDIPSFSFQPEQCQYSRFPGKPPKCTEDSSYYDRQKDLYVPIFRKLEKDNERVRIIDPTNLLCNDQECRMTDNKELLYRDRNHLSYEGSQYIGGWVGSQIQRRD